MATLTGKTPASTYLSLLKVGTTDNQTLISDLKTIEDGFGNSSALQISTAGVKSTGTLEATGVTTLGSNLNVDSGTLYVDATNDNVGIGTTSPTQKLSVKGIINSDSYANNYYGAWLSGSTESGSVSYLGLGVWYNQAGYIKWYDNTRLAIYTSNSSKHITLQEMGGNVGIGTTSPSYQLHLSTDSAGKPTTNTWTITSDKRIKKDIVDADLQRCFEIVKNLKLVHHSWADGVYLDKSINDKSQLGWIADDVELVFPKAVQKVKFDFQEQISDGFETYFEKEFIDEEIINENGEKEIIKKEIEVEKQREKFKPIQTIDDCKSLNADQIFKAMYGAVQFLIQKVEALENK